MNKIHGISISEVDNIVGLAPKTRKMTETVTALFSFCADDYHLSRRLERRTRWACTVITFPVFMPLNMGDMPIPHAKQY